MKKSFAVSGMIAGIVIIFLGFYIAFSISDGYNSHYTESMMFGADFYTEQYTATKNVADNINSIGYYLEKVIKMFGFVTSAFGLVVECYFGGKLAEYKEKNRIAAPVNETVEQVSESLPEI